VCLGLTNTGLVASTLLQGVDSDHWYAHLASGVAGVVVMVLGGVLFQWSGTWARGLFPKRGTAIEPPLTPSFEILLIGLFGLYLALTSLPGVAVLVVEGVSAWQRSGSGRSGGLGALSRRMILGNLGTLVQLGVGTWLFVFPHQVRRLRLRFAAAPPSEASPPSAPAQGCPLCGHLYTPGDYRSEATEWRCSRCGESLPRSDET
jgi:hypothetical protein